VRADRFAPYVLRVRLSTVGRVLGCTGSLWLSWREEPVWSADGVASGGVSSSCARAPSLISVLEHAG
jgi:hypothetical protein